ncbi:AGAP004804-PA-like protein [Anopheles sinensis]|uniref:AGAP004804-PA-like protein n=1 Tax=Anopheles sinensis TaxID=74873 RepID=A0A084W9P4_ANOSI|nr:AGAP004804-PA-like protein [Anopheles sinensis]
MSSPTDRNSMGSSSKYDGKSPPLYHSTERFNPLGYSTPQQQQRGHASQQRNYYSAQPKYMLPRTRGFHNRSRSGQNDYHNRSHGATQEIEENDNDMQGNSPTDAGRQNYNRNWRGHQNRNFGGQRYGGQRHQHNFRQKHQARGTSCNIADYFHPSMLEDPWEFFMRKTEREPSDRTEHSIVRDSIPDANAGPEESSNSADEG